MRDVKFRGYDPDTKRWYYGSYVRLERSTPYPMSQTPELDANKFEAEQVDHYIFFTESMDWGLPTRKLKATVDPNSVGEYTGQKDTKGVEIYEGDIIYCSHVENERNGPVKFSDIHHAWIIDYPRYKGDNRDRWEFMHGKEHCYTVTGNIYENPELLK